MIHYVFNAAYIVTLKSFRILTFAGWNVILRSYISENLLSRVTLKSFNNKTIAIIVTLKSVNVMIDVNVILKSIQCECYIEILENYNV